MAETTQIMKVSIKDQNQRELDAGDYKGIEIDFTPPGPAEVKINLDGNATLVTQKQKFQVTFPSQDTTMIKGANYSEPDKYTLVYQGNSSTITIEEPSGSNSIEEVYVTSTSDGTGWRQLNLQNNNPSQVVILLKRPEIPPPEVVGDFPVNTTWYYESKEVTDKAGKMTSSSYYPTKDSVCIPSGASSAKNHKVKDGYIEIDTGGGNGRIYWDYVKVAAMKSNPKCGKSIAFAGVFKLQEADNLSIKDGNHGTDGSTVVDGMVFGGFGLSFHETQAESKEEYWHNEQGDGKNFPYPNGKKILRDTDTAYFLTLTSDEAANTVTLNAWLKFSPSESWTQVIKNRKWTKDDWSPGSIPSGSDKEDIKAGPGKITRHHIWTRSNTGSCLIKDVKIGIPI
jgi:hypothetical protein